jgi:hypothetical protein
MDEPDCREGDPDRTRDEPLERLRQFERERGLEETEEPIAEPRQGTEPEHDSEEPQGEDDADP